MKFKEIKSGTAIKVLQFMESHADLNLPVNIQIPLLKEDVEFSLSLLFSAGYIGVLNSKLFINDRGREYIQTFVNHAANKKNKAAHTLQRRKTAEFSRC